MFGGGSKPPTFGQAANTTGFGVGFNSGAGFGQSSFGKPAAAGFGQTNTLFGTNNQSTGLFGQAQAPAFNSTTATTQAGFGGFGQQPQQQQQNTSLFGSTAAAGTTSLFGTTTGSAFGQAVKPTGFGGFGAQPQTSLFGQASTSNAATGGFFGQPQQQQQQQQQATVGGLFGSATPAFGAATAANGTAVVKYSPFLGSDTIVKNGQQSNVNTKQHCITFMKEYENKSVEELRIEDYQANRKGPQAGSTVGGGLFGSAQPATGGLFGTQQPVQQTGGLFGQAAATAQPLFGTATNTMGGSTFGQAAPAFGVAQPQTSQASLFSKPFAATPVSTPSTFGFGNTGTAFGAAANKPFGAVAASGGMFGQSAAGTSTFGQPAASTFGGFGAASIQQQQPQTSLFGAAVQQQPVNTGFGGLGQANNTGFGGFAAPNTSTASSFFGAKPTTGFGATTAFGAQPAVAATGFGGGFGQQNTGSLFNTSLNKPTTTFGGFGGQQPAAQPALGTGLNFNTGTSLFGNTATKPGGMFGTAAAPSVGGMFGSTFGGGVATNTMGAMGTNTFGGVNTLGTANVAQPTIPIHQQILAMATSPYGDNPIFKDLKPMSGPSEDALKPTNPAAQNAIYESSINQFKVSPKVGNGIRIKPVTSSLSKKSLFEGLEESDKTLEESFSLKPNAKRLIIKPKSINSINQSLTKTLNISATSNVTHADKSKQSSSSFNQSDSFNNQAPLNPIENNDTSRRTSWLQTNALVKARQSVRSNDSILENTLETLVTGKENIETASKSQASAQESATTSQNNELEKHANDSMFASRSHLDDTQPEANLNEDYPPHLTGITLHRSGYYTIPSLDELVRFMDEKGGCVVDTFTIGRRGYGSVFFADSFDVAGLNLDELVHFRHKEVTIYPNDENKPPVNCGLNRKAQVTLDKVWPHDKTLHEPIKDAARLAAMDFEGYLRRVCDKHDTRFLEYRPDTGSWVFKVDHFSKYGLSDSDDDDSLAAADAKKAKLIETKIGKTGAIPKGAVAAVKTVDQAYKNNLFQTTESSAAFLEIATGDLYPRLDAYVDDDDFCIDLTAENFGLDFHSATKSPSAALANKIGNDSHKVQLMKASFFIDDDNFDRASVISDVTEGRESPDQMVPFVRQYDYQTQFLSSQQQPHKPQKNDENNLKAGEKVQASFEHKQNDRMEVEFQLAIPKPIGPRSLPLIVKPKKVLVNVVDTFVDMPSSILSRMTTQNKNNLAFFNGRKFKVGWGLKNTCMFLNSEKNCDKLQMAHNLYELTKFFNGRPVKDQSAQAVQQLQIGTCKIDDDFEESIVDHLNIQLKFDKIQQIRGSDCPYFEAAGGTAALAEHLEMAKSLAALNELAAYSSTVWALCSALWGYCYELDDIEELSHKDVMFRRDAFSDWMENVVSETGLLKSTTQKDQYLDQLLDLIMSHKISDACDLAFANNDVNLALLLAQISGGPAIRQLIKHQLSAWQEVEIDKFIAPERLKAYMLIAGISLLDSSNGPINVFDNIDWLKALALNLWYLCSSTSSITDAIISYDNDFQAEEFYARPPNPAYTKKIKIQSTKPVYDVRYHLLKLYSKRSHPIESLLNPATHTPDAMDYRLSYLLLQILDTLGYHHCSELSRAQIYTSFADQLENNGLWHWSIYILLHIKDQRRRELCVQQILYRYIDLSKDPEYLEKEKFVIEKLEVPAKWIYWAKAVKAGSNRNYHQQAKYLLCAKQWSMAHKIIMQHIAPDAIINDNIPYLESLINQIEDFKQVNNWSTQGQIIVDFIELSKKFEALTLATEDGQIQQRLEELKSKLSDLCSVIKLFPCPTSKHRLCQTEISIKLLFLIRKFFTSNPYINSCGLMRLALDKLPLPQEYAQQEQRHMLSSFLTEDFRIN